MTYLGSLTGFGSVNIGGEVIGDAEYDIRVYQPRNLKEAHGTLKADDGVLWKIYDSQAQGNATLLLEDGQTINFLIDSVSVGTGTASIAISGPIPGF